MQLVPQGPQHLQRMFEFSCNNDQVFAAAFAEVKTLDAFAEHWHRNAADSNNLFFAIVVDGLHVGSVGKWVMGETPELAYWIGADFVGKGLATRAVGEFLRVFTERPIFAHVVNDNPASIRVLEKNGFLLVDSFQSFASGRQAEVTELEYRLDKP